MNPKELDELILDCPVLYHMAESGSWPSIKRNGLLSTSALLDRYEFSGVERKRIESERRAKSVVLDRANLGRATVRDQLPMDDKGLQRCLQDGLSPAAWYRLLNGRVFFWLTHDRLLRLLNAGTYREQEHDVIELDTKPFLEEYRDKIWLCPINSGCTKPFPHPRGKNTFQRIPKYPYSDWRKKRRSGERVVELSVDYSVPDISKFVRRVSRMRGSNELSIIVDKT